ncbi:putative antigenic protein [Trypanosoma rangeli]|uniref:Putative antigenic protein n=1 Tax=Trypanosoma rangeli TaxID=5698 RepID=A0A422NQ85_TRYRA|nr:putative antigenic protein [Trypanosoma rangeli]RNF07643.1 putative antigenic protein [Trypanosoma rangeli]|eukprot:RNF07643.1 putative antigenic protein [Trypanosoma rangeli]
MQQCSSGGPVQSPSYSSFYVQLRRAYAPVESQRRPEVVRVPPSAEMTISSPSLCAPSAEGRNGAGAIAEIERKLAAIRRQNDTLQYRYNGDQHVEEQRCRQGGGGGEPQQQQQQRQGASSAGPLVHSGQGDDPGKRLGVTVEREDVDLVSPVLSSPSSRSSNENLLPTNQPSLSLPSAVPETKETDDDERLTPQEMASLRVIELAVPAAVYAQLEPGASLVEVCAQATVKLFPSHLVLLRPDGVAAVELVIGELYELNEDESACALDCIVQARGTTRQQLIRLTCADAIARGALFKLLCARRTQLEEGPERPEEKTCGTVSRS